MINKVGIKNYKSIVDIQVNLGRVNVIIGANGSGKSNILEAIALASSANLDRLEESDLSQVLRLSDPEFMFSKFEEEMKQEDQGRIAIDISYDNDKNSTSHLLYKNSKWVNGNITIVEKEIIEDLLGIINEQPNIETKERVKKLLAKVGAEDTITKESDSIDREGFLDYVVKNYRKNIHSKPNWASYLIYAPEESELREFSKIGQLRPLGRKGEGLFQHLKELISDDDNNQDLLMALNSGLSLLDWFEGFDIPKDLFTEERRLNITDRFLKETSKIFDQRSTNEGFLFLLFYLTLFNSKKTPTFFAIDNIENALNPKLARKLTTHLIEVAKKRDKQVIFTTHSPYVLDGLDLSDDEQRLFVVDRNIDGHTEVNRIPHRENRTKQLSELWMSGVLGGLPDNF